MNTRLAITIIAVSILILVGASFAGMQKVVTSSSALNDFSILQFDDGFNTSHMPAPMAKKEKEVKAGDKHNGNDDEDDECCDEIRGKLRDLQNEMKDLRSENEELKNMVKRLKNRIDEIAARCCDDDEHPDHK
jgi:peptidoglycan hydrolase CwlO-like protein